MGPKARAPKAVETMTEYEMEREARLAKNREVLQRLGVPEIVAATRIAADDDVDDDDEARRRRERERKRKARARDAGGGKPARRSTRVDRRDAHREVLRGQGEAGDDDDDSFDGSEDEEDADGSTEDDAATRRGDDAGRARRRREAEGGPEETGARARATRDRREPVPTPQPGDTRAARALRDRRRDERKLPTTERVRASRRR